MHADVDGAARTARAAAEFDWTWAVEDLTRFCLITGWEITELRKRGASVTTNLAVNRPDANVSFGDGEMKYLSIYITDSVDSNAGEMAARQVDLFADLSTRLTTELGSPTWRKPGSNAKVGWNKAKARITLTAIPGLIHLRIVNPAYQEWIDSAPDKDYR